MNAIPALNRLYHRKYSAYTLLNEYGAYLYELERLASTNKAHHELICSLIVTLQNLAEYEMSDPAGSSSADHQSHLRNQISTLLMDASLCATQFSMIVIQYCHDEVMRKCLHDLMQALVGPVVKLSKSIIDSKVCLSIIFPDSYLRNLFLDRLDYPNSESSLNQLEFIVPADHSTEIYIPAKVAMNQTLEMVFSSEVKMNRMAKMLNLIDSKFVTLDPEACKMSINDRRILDTITGYHIAISCPFFRELCSLHYGSRMFNQVLRSDSVDSARVELSNKLPKELAVKISLMSVSSDVIDLREQTDIVATNLNCYNIKNS